MTPSQHPGIFGVEADSHLTGVGRVVDGDHHALALPPEVDAGGLAEKLGVDDGRGEAILAGPDLEGRGPDAERHLAARILHRREPEIAVRDTDR